MVVQIDLVVLDSTPETLDENVVQIATAPVRTDTDAPVEQPTGERLGRCQYGLHMTCTNDAFPKLIQVETASTSDNTVLDQKAETIWTQLKPDTLTADDGYTQAMRICNWAKQGVCLITPALRWSEGRDAEAYHRFLKTPECKQCLRKRKTSVEPLFDLIAKVVGATDNHKQLSLPQLVNVRTCLAIGTLTVQTAMIMNSIWGLPLRNISHMAAVFSRGCTPLT